MPPSLNLLSIGTFYPPFAIGGYEQMWRDAVHRLREEGHGVRVLASSWTEENNGQPEDPTIARRLELYVNRLFDVRAREPTRSVLAREKTNDAIVVAALAQGTPDAVLLGPMGGLPLGAVSRVHQAGIPQVALVADEWPVYGPGADPWQRRLMRRGLNRKALARRNGLPPPYAGTHVQRWVCASEHSRGRVVAAGVDPVSTTVALAGPDTSRFTYSPAHEWRGNLLYCGRLHPDKGVEHAVRALPELPTCELSLAGTGDPRYADKLKRIAAELGVSERLIALGEQHDRLPDLYAGCDAVVFPSTWEEPWGLVPLEAMATGRPVVATAVGGAAEYLRDGVNAVVVPTGDSRAIATAVTRLEQSPDLRAKVVAGGRRTAEELSYERFLKRISAEVLATAEGGRGTGRLGAP